jgi:hypothetical protein
MKLKLYAFLVTVLKQIQIAIIIQDPLNFICTVFCIVISLVFHSPSEMLYLCDIRLMLGAMLVSFAVVYDVME